MGFREFDGALDEPTGFREFTGELDEPDAPNDSTYVAPVDPKTEPAAAAAPTANMDPRDLRASESYQDTLNARQQERLGQAPQTPGRRGATGAALRAYDKAVMGDSSEPWLAGERRKAQTEGMDPRDLRAERESLVRPQETRIDPISGAEITTIGAPLIPTNVADRPEPGVASVATDLVRTTQDVPASIGDFVRAAYGKATGNQKLVDEAQASFRKRRAISERDTPKFSGDIADWMYSGVQSTVQQAPGLAASILTGNPVPGLAWAALSQGAPVFNESLDKGYRTSDASVNAIGQGLMEALFELAPMQFLISKFGKAPVAEFVGGLLVRELPAENATTFYQSALDVATKHSLNSDPAGARRDWQAWFAGLPEAAAHTSIATITQTALVGGASAVNQQRELGQGVRRADAAQEEATAKARDFFVAPPAPNLERTVAVEQALRARDDAAILTAPTADAALEAAARAASRPHPLQAPLDEAMRQTADAELLARVAAQGEAGLADAKQELAAAQQPLVGTQAGWQQPGQAAPYAPVVAGPQPIDIAASQAATSDENDLTPPTDGQRDAVNYQLGHDNETFPGLDLSIQNPAGSKRRPEWPTLQSHYGYIRKTEGADGEHVDVFVRPGTPPGYAGPVFVVDQVKPDASAFDEHKVMLGFDSAEAAERAYRENYTPDWQGLGALTELPFDAFRQWVETGDHKRPIAWRPSDTATDVPVSGKPAGFTEIDPSVPLDAEPAAAAGPADQARTDTPAAVPATAVPAVSAQSAAEVESDLIYAKSGKPWKTRGGAELARQQFGKGKSGFAVVAVDGGFAIKPKDFKPKVRREPVLAADATEDETGEFRRLELLRNLKKAGGVLIDDIGDILGESRRVGTRMAPGLFTKTGKGVDGLAEWMQQNGYIESEAAAKELGIDATEKARKMLRDAVEKKGVFTLADLDELGEKMLAERMARDSDLTTEEVQEVIEQLPADTTIDEVVEMFDADGYLNSAGITDDAERDAIKEQAYYRSRDENTSYEQALRAEVDATRARQAGARPDRPGAGEAQAEAQDEVAPGGDLLANPTPESLREQEARAADTTVADRERADRERDFFALAPPKVELEQGATQQGELVTAQGEPTAAAKESVAPKEFLLRGMTMNAPRFPKKPGERIKPYVAQQYRIEIIAGEHGPFARVTAIRRIEIENRAITMEDVVPSEVLERPEMNAIYAAADKLFHGSVGQDDLLAAPAPQGNADSLNPTVLDGVLVEQRVRIEDTGAEATLRLDAGAELRELDAREASLRKLLECLQGAA